MTKSSIERQRKLKVIADIIAKQEKTRNPTGALEWYGRTFDDLYDKDIAVLKVILKL